MKKLFIIFLIIPFISISNPISNFGFNDVDNFKELNAGICFFGDDYIYPGCSFLWGRSIYYSNNTALEFKGGLAFPTILTAKIGYGVGNINSKFLISIRPLPLSIGFQYDTRRTTFSVEKLVGGFVENYGNGTFGDSWIAAIGFRIR